jgi:hypothetical protein
MFFTVHPRLPIKRGTKRGSQNSSRTTFGGVLPLRLFPVCVFNIGEVLLVTFSIPGGGIDNERALSVGIDIAFSRLLFFPEFIVFCAFTAVFFDGDVLGF